MTTISGSTSFAIETIGCPSADDLADLELDAGDDAVLRRAQRRVLEAIARQLELARVGFGDGARRLRIALRLLLVGRADGAVALQGLQALAVGLRLARLRFGGDELLLRRLHGELVVGVVEHGDDVALANLLADLDLADDDLAADAKGLVDLVARLHGAEVAVLFLRLVVADLHGADGAQPFGRRLLRAAGQDRGDRCGEQCRWAGGFHDGSSGWFHDFGVGVEAAEAGCVAGSKACHPPPSAL